MTDSAGMDSDQSRRSDSEPGWGLNDAIGGWFLGFLCVAVCGAIAVSIGGWESAGTAEAEATANEMPLNVRLLLTVPLWFGLLGVPLWAAKTKGFGMVSDFRLRQIWTDIPLGIIVGVVSQFGMVWVIYRLLSPWIDPDSVDDEARELTDQATELPTIVLLVLIVGIGAPIIEEIFFRGLLYQAIGKRWGTVAAVVGSSIIFGLTHFQLIQLPALIAFGVVLALLVHFTDRLGAALWAHLAFNISTLILLLGFG